MRRSLLAVLALAFTLLLRGSVAGSAESEVDLALVLAVDCSYSVDEREFRLQMVGLAEAFRNPQIIEALGAGPRGRIGVTLLQWSSARAQAVAVPWMAVSDRASAERLAAALEDTPRLTTGATSISGAIGTGLNLLRSAPFEAMRRVIDISSDGINNNGGLPAPVRDRAILQGVTINGLAILTEVPYLDAYFRRFVAGGSGNFVITADDYDAYREAIQRKLLREIQQPVS